MSFSKLKLEAVWFWFIQIRGPVYDTAEFEMTSTARNATNFEKKKIPMYGENKMFNFPAKSRWVQGCREDQLKTPPVEEGWLKARGKKRIKDKRKVLQIFWM